MEIYVHIIFMIHTYLSTEKKGAIENFKQIYI